MKKNTEYIIKTIYELLSGKYLKGKYESAILEREIEVKNEDQREEIDIVKSWRIIRTFIKLQEELNQDFSKILYYSADRHIKGLNSISISDSSKQLQVIDVLNIVLVVTQIEFYGDYSSSNYSLLEKYSEKLVDNINSTLIVTQDASEYKDIQNINTKMQELIILLLIKIAVLMNIIAYSIPDKLIEPKELKDYFQGNSDESNKNKNKDFYAELQSRFKDFSTIEKVKKLMGVLYDENDKYNSKASQEIIKCCLEGKENLSMYYNYLIELENKDKIDKLLKKLKIIEDHRISDSYLERINDTRKRFRRNTLLSLYINKGELTKAKELINETFKDASTEVENYYFHTRKADYYSKLIDIETDTDKLIAIKKEIKELNKVLHNMRITPYKAGVIPYLLPINECIYTLESIDGTKYELLLLHPVTKVYHPQKINNLIDKTIFECYQHISKIDNIIAQEAQKEANEKTLTEIKNDRVRSIEILSIFSAVALFSLGSVNVLANQKEPKLVFASILGFGSALALFLNIIFMFTGSFDSKEKWVRWGFSIGINVIIFVVALVYIFCINTSGINLSDDTVSAIIKVVMENK